MDNAPRFKTAFFPFPGGVFFVLLLLFAAVPAFAEENPKNGPAPDVVTVFDPQNLSGPEWDWISIGLQDAMTVDLWYVRTLYAKPAAWFIFSEKQRASCPDFKLECVCRLDVGAWKEDAANMNLDWFLWGDYSVEKESVTVRLAIYKAPQWQIAREIQYTVKLARLLPETSARLLKMLVDTGITVQPVEKYRIKRLKTRSPEAVRENALGYWSQQRYYRVEGEEKERVETAWKEHLEQAVKEDPLYAEAWNNLGWYWYSVKKYEDALRVFKLAVELKPYLIDANMGLGACYKAMDFATDSLPYFMHAIQANPSITAHTIYPLEAFSMAGKTEVGLDYVEHTILMLRKTKETKDLGTHLSWKGRYLYDLGEYAAAEKVYYEVQEINQKVYPPGNINHRISNQNLANVLYVQKKYEKSESFFIQVLEDLENQTPPEIDYITNTLSSIGSCNYLLGRFEKAVKAYRQAAEMRENASGPDHEQLGVLLYNWARSLSELERYDEAIPIYLQSFANKEKNFGLESREVSDVLFPLAEAYFDSGRFEDALVYFKKLLPLEIRLSGEDSLEVALIRVRMSEAYEKLLRFGDAIDVLSKAMPPMEKEFGRETSTYARNLSTLAKLYFSHGDSEKALELYGQEEEIWEKVTGPESEAVASALISQASVLIAKGDYQAATPPLKRALEIRIKILEPDDPDLGDSYLFLAGNLQALGDHATAEPLFLKALAILEQSPRPDSRMAVITTLAGMIKGYRELGQYKKAEPYALRQVELLENSETPDTEELARAYMDLALVYADKGDPAGVESYRKKALAEYEKAFGPDSPLLEKPLKNMARMYRDMGRYDDAIVLVRRVLANQEKEYGPDHEDVAATLIDLGALLYTAGKYSDAEGVLSRGLKLMEKAYGPDHRETAGAAAHLARVYDKLRRFDQARTLYRKALDGYRNALGSENALVANVLNSLGNNAWATGDFAQAEQYYRQALELSESTLWPKHPTTAVIMAGLASALANLGRMDEAGAMFERVLEIQEKLKGPGRLQYAEALNKYALFLYESGDRTGAEDAYRHSLEIQEKHYGPDHPTLAPSMLSLALVLQERGDFAGAETLYLRGIDIIEQTSGPESPDAASAYNNLAAFYREIRRLDEAGALYKKALAIREKTLGPNHPDVATSLNNLADFYSRTDPEKAAELFLRAIEIDTKVFGPGHPRLALGFSNLGTIFLSRADYDSAEKFYQKALGIREKALPPDHPDVASSQMSLAALYYLTGKYEESEKYNRLALASLESRLGATHPNISLYLYPLAFTVAQNGRYAKSHDLFMKAMAIDEPAIENIIGFTAEKEKLAFLMKKKWALDSFLGLVALHLDQDQTAVRDAMDTWLKRKGMVLEAQKKYQEALFYTDDDQTRELFRELVQVRARLSKLAFTGPGHVPPEQYRAEIESLESRKRELEAVLSRLSSNYDRKRKADRADTTSVAKALPAGTALVEFARIAAFNFNYKEEDAPVMEDIYLAFILSAGGESVRLINLGNAGKIDKEIESLRKAIEDPRDSKGKRTGNAAGRVYELVFAPLEKILGGAETVFLSPDGNLNLIPFEVLRDKNANYLIERYTFNYLSTGRDLISIGPDQPTTNKVMLFGAPAYDMDEDEKQASLLRLRNERGVKPESAVRGESLDTGDLRGLRFTPLPGAKEEVVKIAEVVGAENADVYTGPAALEEVLFSAKPPKILHLATHGFFLSDGQVDRITGGASIFSGWQALTNAETAGGAYNPLVRSGLALAGANRALNESSSADGLLTAEKVLGLNLRGTELVVLSACNTGVGEVKSGEGVFGLRRAFAQTGARGLVMSMWPVPDLETKELMVRLYQYLESGMKRSEALRRAALEQMKIVENRYGHTHPGLWGAFVYLGAE